MAPADLLSLKIRCAAWPAVYSKLLRALGKTNVWMRLGMTESKKHFLTELHLGQTWEKDLVDLSVLRGPSAQSECNGQGNSLRVQWLGLSTSTAGAMGLIPGWGAKSLQAVWCSQKTKTKIQWPERVAALKCLSP